MGTLQRVLNAAAPPRHRHLQVRPRSVNANSRPTPLAQRSRTRGVQAGCHGPSVSGEQSTRVSGQLQCTPVADVASRHRRSANLHRLIVPRYRRSTLGRRAFSVGGSTVWNTLPVELIELAVSDSVFRRTLKTILFAR